MDMDAGLKAEEVKIVLELVEVLPAADSPAHLRIEGTGFRLQIEARQAGTGR